MDIISLINDFVLSPAAIVDIFLTAVVLYSLARLMRGSQATRLLIGMLVLYIIYLLAQWLGLVLLTQLMQAAAVVGVLALVVIFQPELRQGLARLGNVGSLSWLLSPADQEAAAQVAEQVARAAAILAGQRHGMLVVIERQQGLDELIESGVRLDAELSAELLTTIFLPPSALHDGAVVIRQRRILGAGVILPLAENGLLGRMGTRHRAALGIASQTDALAVVVSEETGTISLAEGQRLHRRLDEEHLREFLLERLREQWLVREQANVRIAEARSRLQTHGRPHATVRSDWTALRKSVGHARQRVVSRWRNQR